ncbi:hypothetical protein V2W45_1440579 [Cenococcum geophilum]
MIPSRIVMVDQMPLNANGKIDRKALARRAQTVPRTDKATSARVAARNEIEAVLCEEFADVLGIEVGITDNFFDLGGHSLMATKLAARISRRLDARVSVKDVFDQPVLANLAALIRQGSTPHNPIIPAPYCGPVEQSFAQGRLWFLDQLNLGASWYLMPLALRLRGPLRVNALSTALFALEQRHETLRTTFEEQDGGLKIIDVTADHHSNYTQVLQEEQTIPFDLASEPGWRVSLLLLGQDDYILSIVMHHIIYDGWSIDILCQELSQFYAAALRDQEPLSQVNPLPIQYRDFSVWQKQPEQVAEHQRQLEYWTTQLADSAPAELLTDLPRPAILSSRAGVVQLAIEGPVYERLRAFCRVHQTTSFAVLLAVFRAAHYRLTGAKGATIGTPIANRNRPELESMIGFFVNTQCMRITVEDDDTFKTLVRQVRSTVTAAFANQDVPFERIVSALLPGSRDTSRNPLVQLMFAIHSQKDLGKIQLEGIVGEPIPAAASTRFDLEFHMFQEVGRLSGSVLFATDLFEPETIQGMVAIFQEILRRVLEQPQTPIAVLPLTDGLADLRSMGLLEIERTDYPRESSVVDVFREQAAACPDATAVKDSSSQLTYAQLDRQSDEVATWLRRRSIPAETLVGTIANLAYLPLDVNIPAARIEAVLLSVVGHKLVLLEIQLADVELVRIDDTLGHNVPDNSTRASPGPSATSLAYVIFTSGSTGQPKGVKVEHRGIVRLVKQSNAARVAHLSNIAFDAATWEIYAPLLNGGAIVCIDYFTTLDSKALEVVFAREHIRAAMLPPALLKQCLINIPATIGALDVVFAAGDRFDRRDAAATQALVGAGNTILSTIHNVREGESYVNGVPIGRPQLVLLGVMGELVVAMDVDRFIKIVVDGQMVRAYRTGDRARYRPKDGQIEFFGRMDQQIKIRGHRIEPAEVEHAMLDHSAVRDAAVVETEMVGFVVHLESQEEQFLQTEKEIRNRLQTLLPPYMVPARIMVLNQMPLNANGKTAPRREVVAARVAPCNEEFADVLGVEVGITDNFFDLGGHSLLATKLAARISRRLLVRVSVKDVFDQPMPGHAAGNGLLPFEDPQQFITRILDKHFLRNPATGHPRTPSLFFLDFPPDSDCARLSWACGTVFYQVVLEHLEVPIQVVEIEEDVTAATSALKDEDLQHPLRLGQSRGSSVRVHIVNSLHALYNSNRLPTPPKFARRKDVIKSGSSARQQPGPEGAWFVEKATVFTTACTLMLAKMTGSRDVLFSRLVSGRQCLPTSCQHIVGPCTNIVPVQLLHKTLGFEDIKENCTDWPEATTNYGCCSIYQNFEIQPESQGLTQDPRTLKFRDGDATLNRRILDEAPMHNPDGLHLRDTFCEIILTLNLALQDSLTRDVVSI